MHRRMIGTQGIINLAQASVRVSELTPRLQKVGADGDTGVTFAQWRQR